MITSLASENIGFACTYWLEYIVSPLIVTLFIQYRVQNSVHCSQKDIPDALEMQ